MNGAGIYFAIGKPVRPRVAFSRNFVRIVCGPFALFFARFDLDRAFIQAAIDLDKLRNKAPGAGQEGRTSEC